MNDKQSGAWLTLKLLGDLGFLIAVPLVVFGLVGRMLDRKFGTSPWLLLAGLVISLIVTSISIYKKTLQLTADMENEIRKADEKTVDEPGKNGQK